MKSIAFLALLLVVAIVAVGAPESHPAFDFRGAALLTITVVVTVVEGLRRLP